MPTLPALMLTVLTLAPAQLETTDIASPQERAQAREHFRTGLEKLQAESWDEAAGEFRAAVELDPLMAIAYYGLGQARMGARRYPEAVEAYLSCRETHQKLNALEQSNSALADRRREEEIGELRESIQLVESGAVRTASVQGMVVNLETRLRQLESERGRGVTIREVPAEVSLALGSAYFRTGDLENAELEYREAIRVNSEMGEAHNNLAVVCMLTGKLDEAQKEVKAAEKSGFRVHPQFKADLEQAVEEASQR